MKTFFQENKTALLFILKFVGLYLLLNTAYGFYIEFYSPLSDPLTIAVTRQAAGILSLFHEIIHAIPDPSSSYVMLQKDFQTIVNVFEGCNGINVMIVYLSFLLAFKGAWKSTIIYFFFGLVIIYCMNMVRILLLFEIAYYFPERLYFFHKYFFTGIIYVVVFIIWYFWIKRIRLREKQQA